VRLHTHLAENKSDVDYSLAKFGKIPGDYAESVGWLGDDVWHAHCVKLSDDSILKFGRTGTGVAHCPCSNMRLASGIAPIRKMLNHGVPVGLGVDGSQLFVCEGNNGLKIFDITLPTQPKLQQTLGDVKSFDVIPLNKVLLVTGEGGFLQYSYRNEGKMELLSKISIEL
jgi:hypothetical protein